MLTINDAIDYATDHGVKVSDDYQSKVTGTRAMCLSDGFTQIEIRQWAKWSKRWEVEGIEGTFTRAQAITRAVDEVLKQTRALDKEEEKHPCNVKQALSEYLAKKPINHN